MYKLNKRRKLARLVMAVYGYIISLANFRLLVYKVTDLSNAIQRAHKVAKNKHNVDTATILFAQCRTGCAYFFFVIERNVLMVFLSYQKNSVKCSACVREIWYGTTLGNKDQ